MNYPSLIYSPSPWTERDEAPELFKCYVTENLYSEDEVVLDVNTGRWFHPDQVDRYNDLCALEFEWDEEEKAGNLETLKELI